LLLERSFDGELQIAAFGVLSKRRMVALKSIRVIRRAPPRSTAVTVPCMRRRLDGRDESKRCPPQHLTSATLRGMSTTVPCTGMNQYSLPRPRIEARGGPASAAWTQAISGSRFFATDVPGPPIQKVS
jgi:hypothetical protein